VQHFSKQVKTLTIRKECQLTFAKEQLKAVKRAINDTLKDDDGWILLIESWKSMIPLVHYYPSSPICVFEYK